MNARALPVAMRWVLASMAAAFIAIAAAGVARRYTPVPVYDIWAALRFYARLAQGDYGVWWIQHLEHRIVLAKVLYWLDWKLFGAREISLLVESFALLGVIVLVLLAVARELLSPNGRSAALYALGTLLAVFCFSWTQEENLVHGFQVAFFLAYVVPLLAFVALAKSGDRASGEARNEKRWFAATVVLGVLSAGTMANGVLVLPLLVVAAALQRQPARRIVILALAAVVTIAVFSIGYVTPAHHRAPVAGLLADARGVLVFLLRLIGSPAHGVVNSALAAEITGAAVIGAGIASAVRWWRRPARPALELALLMFFGYALVSALAAAAGRAHFGLDYAFSTRYATIALLAWSALAVIVYAQWQHHPRARGALATIALVVPIAFLPSQLAALQGDTGALRHRQATAALALELGARDIDATHWIFPNERIFERAEEARAQQLSIFSDSQFGGLRESIGHPAASLGLHRCDGFIETVTPLEAQPEVARISGWAFDRTHEQVPPRVYIVGADQTVVGVGITGTPRPDVVAAIHPNAGLAGFDAYRMRIAAEPLQLHCPP